MQKINYKSDFDFVLDLTDDQGNGIGWPDYDFMVEISTPDGATFVASNIGGVLTNCFDDEGTIHVVCDNHGLGQGPLSVVFVADLENTGYPDGSQWVEVPIPVDIELVRSATSAPAAGGVTVSTPMAIVTAYDMAVRKGYRGTEEEFVDALTRMPQAVGDASTAAAAATAAATAAHDAANTAESAIVPLTERVEAVEANVGTRIDDIEAQLAEGVGRIDGITVNGEAVEPDADKVVHLTISPDADETLNINSTNPVSNRAVAAEFENLGRRYGAEIRLNTIGEGDDQMHSLSLIAEDGTEISTTDTFTAGGSGSGSAMTTRVELAKVSDNPTVKAGDTVRLAYRYDQIDIQSEGSTGNPAEITIAVLHGATSSTMQMTANAGSTNTIDVTQHLVTGANTVRVTAVVGSGETRQVKTISWTVQVVELKLTSSFNFAAVVTRGERVTIPYMLQGGYGAKLKTYIDGLETERDITSSAASGTIDVATASMSHGTHTIQVVAELPLSSGGVIRSNAICFDIAVRVEGETAPIVAARFDIPSGQIVAEGGRPLISTKQYETYSLTFAVFDPLHDPAAVSITENGRVVSTLSMSHGAQTLTQRTMEQGSVAAAIVCGETSYTFGIDVAPSDVDLTEPTGGLTLKLTATGRNNAEANKAEWVSGDIAATFEGVRFADGVDGWTGTTLKVASTGRVIINHSPLRQPSQNATQATATVIRYKVTNPVDEAVPLIACVDADGTGFEITATEARMRTRGRAELSMKMEAGTTYEVAFVTMPQASAASSKYEREHSMMSMLFIDGINSGCVQRAAADSVYQSGAANIVIAAQEAAVVEVMSIRTYSTFLTDDQVLALHTIDQDSTDEMMALYDANNILDTDGKISVDSVPAGMRVVVVTGEWSNGMPTLLAAAVNNDKDPKFDVTSILSYIAGSTDLSANFYLRGGCIRLQGTSSLAYPIKNYRLYIKNASKVAGQLYVGCDRFGSGGTLDSSGKFSFRPGAQHPAAPVNCWCLKADYAESSSSHNTGLARLVQNTLVAAGEMTPPQKAVDRSRYPYDVRTTVDGEPCLLFYRKTEADTPIFLGKYNFNNDKSTEAVFGFCDIPGYHDADWVATYPDGNPTECWEFLNNDYPMGSFLDADFDALISEADIDDEDDAADVGKPKWCRVFEARFPDDDDLNEAYESGERKPVYLEAIVKWVNSTNAKADGLTEAQQEARRQKFRAELQNYFDVDYLCDYYVITDVFAAVDQRVKNMMMGIWHTPAATEHEVMGKMRAYMIFYDNDTILGVRNDGRLKYDWDIDENTLDPELSQPNKPVYCFAGHDSVLWQNLRDCFADELKAAYRRLRQRMSNSDVFRMFDDEQSAKFPARIYNVDATNKYIVPKTVGVEVVENGQTRTKTYSYMESLQGSRKSQRHYFVENRFAYFDAWAGTGDYAATDLTWKGNSAAGAKVSVTMARKYFAQIRRESTVMRHVTLNPGEAWEYTYPEVANIGTIFHLLGGKWISTVDLSDWGGFTDLSIPHMPVLESLTIGRTGSGKTYPLTEIAVGNNLPMLRSFVCQGYDALPSIDLGGCSLLELADFGGCTAMTSVSIAAGAPLHTLIMPDRIPTITLAYLDSLALWDGSRGLKVDNLAAVRHIDIAGTPQVANSTEWISEWLGAKTATDAQCSLRLSGIAWTNVSADLLIRLGSLGTLDLRGSVTIAETPTTEQALELLAIYGEQCFEPGSALHISAPGAILIAAPATIVEGSDEAAAVVATVLALGEVYDLRVTATPSSASVHTRIEGRKVFIWADEDGTARTVRINANGVAGGHAISQSLTIDVVALTYPSAFAIETSVQNLTAGASAGVTVTPNVSDCTGSYSVAYTLSGSSADVVTIEAEANDGCRLTVAGNAGMGSVTLSVVATKANGQQLWSGSVTLPIITADVAFTSATNPVVMAICHAQGWAADANYMTKAECAAVTDIGSAFKDNNEITSLDELQYFTGLRRIDEYQLERNYKMESIILPEGLTRIMPYVMNAWNAISRVELPSTLTTIREDNTIYSGAGKNTQVYFNGETPPNCHDGLFAQASSPGTIYVPASAQEAYLAKAYIQSALGKNWTLATF